MNWHLDIVPWKPEPHQVNKEWIHVVIIDICFCLTVASTNRDYPCTKEAIYTRQHQQHHHHHQTITLSSCPSFVPSVQKCFFGVFFYSPWMKNYSKWENNFQEKNSAALNFCNACSAESEAEWTLSQGEVLHSLIEGESLYQIGRK